MSYRFNFAGQMISAIVSFLIVVAITRIFDGEIKWALAVAVAIGTFFTSGFYGKGRDEKIRDYRFYLFGALSLALAGFAAAQAKPRLPKRRPTSGRLSVISPAPGRARAKGGTAFPRAS